MKTQRLLLAISLFALCGQSSFGSAADIEINEVVSSNNATITDENGDYSDWIELHNTGTTPVDLTGWGLTDLPTTPFKWVFPARTLEPDAYLIVWASSKDRAAATGPLHTNFGVSASGESLALTEPLGTNIDLVPIPALPANVSYGRKPGQGDSLFYFETPTPNAANTTPGYPDLAIPPTFSQPGGFHTVAFSLEINAQPGWTIYYTLDGSDPDPSRVGAGAQPYRVSRFYSAPISVASRTGQANVFSQFPTTAIVKSWQPTWHAPADEVFKGTVIRAIARDPATGRTSKSVTRTFFVDPNIIGRYGNLPVISLVSDYNNLFASATGIYVPGNTHGGDFAKQNFFQEWVKPASMELFESNGTTGFSGVYEISNQGSTSPASPQKGLHVIARAELGPDMINYPLFAGTESQANKQTVFKRFILRSWGSALSWPVFFSDAYNQLLAATADQEMQDYRPTIVFINGEYWGLHEIREHNKSSWYHQARTGINRDDPGYDMLEEGMIDEGDDIHWNATMAYVNSNNLANDAVYDYVTTQIDVANFAEYMVHCCFTGKRDWPGQNEGQWRPRTPDGKWRWVQWDMDHGLNDFGAPEYDMLHQVLVGVNGYGPHPLFVKLLQNARFKAMFLNTYADWLNSRVIRSVELARFDAMKASFDPFIAEYDRRWPSTHSWSSTNYGRDILARRNGVRRTQLRNTFNLGSDRAVTLLADATQGVIRCNRFVVDAKAPGVSTAVYPWTGTYFQNLPITLEALPRDGYKFVGWHVKINGVDLPPTGADPVFYSQQALIPLTLTGTVSAEAVFEIIPTVDLHGWTFEGGTDPYPPAFTVGGGTLSVTPSLNTSVSAASQGFLTSHLRVNNPIGTIVQWALPTTGHASPSLSFLTRRSSSGAGTQTLSYTLNGTSWTVFQNYSVADANPQPKSFSFSSIPAASDNPNFAVRIEFSATGGSTTGNNRFDDVVLKGVVIPRAYNATIESTLATSVNVIVSPPDKNGLSNGTTSFTRSYLENSGVSLTAPVTSGGYQFQKWQQDGVDLATTPTVNVTMDNHHTFTAVYTEVIPIITVQPSNVAVAEGGTAIFKVTATGTGILDYQWRFNGTDIPNSDATSYTVSSVNAGNVGSYDVVVSNAAGPVTSNPASLTIVITTLINGSFESDYTGWTRTGNQLVLLLPASEPYVASDGTKIVVFNKGNTTPNGVLSQTFATSPGEVYQLKFDMGILAYNGFEQRLQVNLDGSSLLLSQTFTMVRSGSTVFRSETKTMSFTANSSTTTLTFRDVSPASDSLNMSLDNVRVTGPPPINSNTPPLAAGDTYSTSENIALVVAAAGVLANDTDAESNALTAVLNVGPNHGNLALNPDGSFTYTPAAGYFGSDSFTYHANDGVANSNVVTASITVHEVIPAPVATDDSYVTDENKALVIPAAGVLTNDSDPRSRPLTAILNDGPVHGTLDLNPNGGFTYTPGADYFGTDSFTYHAHNGFLDSNLVTVNLTVNEFIPPPVATDDAYSTNEGIALVVSADGVLANDTDPESRPLIALLNEGPNHGTLELTPDGNFIYTPAAGYFGSDSFTYHARNTFVDSNIATASITVHATVLPPVATDDSYVTDENKALVIPAAGVLTNDSDPRSRPLTAILNDGPVHGTLDLNPNGSFTYIPVTDYFGSDSFTYHARNGFLDSNLVTVNLTVNEFIPPPVATDDAYSTNEGIALVVSTDGVLANDTDPESRPLSAVLDVGPSHGTLDLNPDGNFTYTPAAGYFGSDSFTYHARNGLVDSNIATASITVHEVIPAPVATDDSYVTDENKALVIPAAGVLANDSDPRSRALTAILNDGPAHGTLDLNPNGGFTYTPGADYFGTDSFTYHAHNGFLDSNLVTVNLTVNEFIPPPVARDDAYSTNEGIALVVSTDGVLANDTDPESRPLSAVLNVGPSHGTLDLNPDGNFTYTPAAGYFGSDSFTYHARNGFVDSNIATASITVREVIPAPVATDDSYVTDESKTLVIPAAGVLANDSDPRSRPLTAILNDGPAHGILVLNPNGSFTYTPAADYFGSDSFTYHVRNGFLDSNIATVNLTINEVVFTGLANGSFESDFSSWTSTGNLAIQSALPYAPTQGSKLVAFNNANRTPNAVLSQSFATVAGQTYTLAFDAGVLAYNTSSQSILVTVTGTGSLLSRTVTLIGSGAGTCRWIPQSFTFVANSTSATLAFKDQSTSTINIDMLLDNVRVNIGQAPVNRAPVAVADTYATNAGTQLIIPSAGVLANDTDPDANPLTALLNVGPSHGVLALNTNGSFTYTPASGYTGADAFTYHAYDGSLNSNVVTVSITVNPVATTNFVNGSFESDYTGWIKSGNQGIKSSVAPNLASNGTKYVTFNSGNTAPNGILSQTFATIAGTTYTLAFDVGVLDYVNQQQRLQCTVDGATNLLTRTITLQGTANRAIRWTPQSMTFVANSTSTSLTFRDLSTTTNSIDMQLDNVRVTTAAASAALLSAGSPSSMVGSSKITVEPPDPGNPTLSGVPGDFTIRMTATQAGDYVLERSEDLKTWERIGELQLMEPGTVEFHDKEESIVPEAPPASRFYRIGLLPAPDSR